MNSFDSRSPDWLGADQPLPLEVLDAIRVADCEDGNADQVARLEARLAPLFQAPHGTQSSAPRAAASTSSSLGTLKLAAASVALFGAAVLMWPQREQAALHPVQSAQISSPQVLLTGGPARFDVLLAGGPARFDRAPREPVLASDAPEQKETRSAPLEVAERRDSAPAPRVEKPETGREVRAAGSQNTLALEARLLSRARRSLESNPEQALALAQRHQLRFPHGVLGEEREAIAIKALRRTGQEALAAQRQARFLARYPESPHAMSLAASARP